MNIDPDLTLRNVKLSLTEMDLIIDSLVDYRHFYKKSNLPELFQEVDELIKYLLSKKLKEE